VWTSHGPTLLAVQSLLVVLCLTACAPALERGEYPETYSLAAPATGTLWQDVMAATAALEPDWFVPLDTGPEALRMRLALIDSATATLDAKYFIWHLDRTGSLLLDRVLQAADRGVRVRLLIDDIEISKGASVWRAADEHPNIDVRLYNPFMARTDSMLGRYLKNLNQLGRVNHPMHNKALIVDGTVAMIGGRSVADEYHGFGDEANFRDFDVLTGGDILAGIEVAYDTFWNSGWAVPVAGVVDSESSDEALARVRELLESQLEAVRPWIVEHHAGPHVWREELLEAVRGAVPGAARVLVDRAEVDAPVPAEQIASEITKAAAVTRDNLLFVTPYLVPTPQMLDAMAAMHARGIRIEVLTNSLATNNHLPVHAAYAKHRDELLDRGVQLHEFRIDAEDRARYEASGFRAEHFTLHAKLLMRDDRYIFIDTFNLDPRSITHNTEIGLEVDSPALVAIIRKHIERDLEPENSWRVEIGADGHLQWGARNETHREDPGASELKRLESWILSLAPLENEL
jgi:putative cardiolipin synthase